MVSVTIHIAYSFGKRVQNRRGVRVVNGAALEKRSPSSMERGFESHPLRQYQVPSGACFLFREPVGYN